MLKSMTGYGKAVHETGGKIITVEVKSLNSKMADIYLRIPNLLREKELELRTHISNFIKRGKIECTVSMENQTGEPASQINSDVVKEYFNQLTAIREDLNLTVPEPLLQTILRLPEALKNGKEELTGEVWEETVGALQDSLDQLDGFRNQEGSILEDDLSLRIRNIEKLLADIAGFEQERTDRIRKRLKDNQLEFFTEDSYDKNRLEQEMVYYIEKLDFSEEKVRLQNHCRYFAEVMEREEQAGKKLIFISQEIGREINTIGSKANDFEIQKIVVLMKDELEKVKEQLMNVL